MAVDLGDLVDSLKREVSVPGDFATVFPNSTDGDLSGALSDAFWDARLDGLIVGYTETDGLVTPTSGSVELTRDLQQLVVFYAGYRIVRNALRSISTSFRAKAGPVEYETQQAATQLTEILKDLQRRRMQLLERLSDLGQIPAFYVDAYASRNDSLSLNDITWVSGSA